MVGQELSKRALLVGIDDYDSKSLRLNGCVDDVRRLADLLSQDHDETPYFYCKILSNPPERVTEAVLKRENQSTCLKFDGDILFYYSGHGGADATGGYLVMLEAVKGDLGVRMDDLKTYADRARKGGARSVLIILITNVGRMRVRAAPSSSSVGIRCSRFAAALARSMSISDRR